MCEIMNEVTRYFDKLCVVIFHWNEDEKEREAFIRKKERMIGEERWKTLPNKVNRERVKKPQRVVKKTKRERSLAPSSFHFAKNRLPLICCDVGSEVFIHALSWATVESSNIEGFHDA